MTKLKLSVFRFDAKTDYLPYFKDYEVDISLGKTLYALLEEVKKQDVLFDFPKGELDCVRINNHTISTKIKLQEIVEYFGSCLTIEPLSHKRATKDLIINSDDFKNSLTPILQYISKTDEEKFKEYMRFYYASEMFEFNEDFQGTSLFLFVHELLLNHDRYKQELLKVIADEHSGIWYHTPLCHKTFPKQEEVEEIIIQLKKDILASNIKIKKAI